MRFARRVGSIVAVAAMALALDSVSVEAQVAADAGGQFVGKWTLAFQPMAGPGGGAPGGGGPGGRGPGGGGAGGRMGGPQVLDITVANSQLAATLTGGMGGATSITSISKSGEALVLNYSMSMGGQTIPFVLTLTPDGTGMKAEMQIAGQITRTGTATKE